MNIVIGIKINGERLRFERWAYELYITGGMTDTFLLSAFRSCVSIHQQY